tara:strand:- start:1572 stop:2114 length:543 start_codon:yes stop_codon:yes gene_type:complete
MPLASKALDLFIAYKLLQVMATPFEKTEAFKLGIIDKKGMILKKRKQLKTTEERKAYPSIFYTMAWKMKRLLAKVPFGGTVLGSFAAALWLLKEDVKDKVDNKNLIEETFLKYLKENGYDVSTMLNESVQDDVLSPGIYKLDNKLYELEEKITSFDSILGIPLFKIKDEVVSHEDLQRIS